MALISLTLDTVSKELKATIDGIEVPNVAYFSASTWKDYDDSSKNRVSCNIELSPVESADGDLRVNTSINAYASIKEIKLSKHISQKAANESAQKWLGK